MPFMDMVSNHFTLGHLNALLFAFPFILLSTFVVGGGMLMEPSRTFAPSLSPTSPGSHLRVLCSPVVTSHFYSLAERAIGLVGGRLLPEAFADENGQARAVGTVLLDLAWRKAFEPIETQCGGIFAVALPPGTAELALPVIAVSVRDRRGRAVVLPAAARLHAALMATPEGCASGVRLVGSPTAAVGTAGVAVLDAMRADAFGAPGGLCPGEYLLRLSLHYDESAAASEGLAGNSSSLVGWNTSTPGVSAALLSTQARVRLVVSPNATAATTSEWSVEVPAFYNLSAMTRTTSVVTYTTTSTLHSVRSVARTNVSTVGIAFDDDAVASYLNASAFDATDADHVQAALSGRVVTWPANTSEPTSTVSEAVEERAPTHILSFVTRPPEVVTTRDAFGVTLRLTTETGLSIAGEQVQAVLLAPVGSGARLAKGALGHTDEAGLVHMELVVEGGATGDYTLLFGSRGTMRAELRQDLGVALAAVSAAVGIWRQLVEPLAGSVGVARSALVDGTLHEVIQRRVDAAVQAHMAQLAAQVESCLALLNFTQSELEREQQLQVALNVSFTPSDGLAGLLSGLVVDDLRWANFERSAVESAAPDAMPCYEQARAAMEGALGVGGALSLTSGLSSALVEATVEALGLEDLGDILAALAPHAAELDAHLFALNQTAQLVVGGVDHFTQGDATAASWRGALKLVLLLAFGFGAPPAATLRVENPIASVELTAPLAGFALFASASTDPSRNMGATGVIGSACVRGGYPHFMPSLREDVGPRGLSIRERAATAVKDSTRLVSAMPVASPLWQPPLFFSQNWLLDTSKYINYNDEHEWLVGASLPHAGTMSPLCESSFIASGQVMPGTVSTATATAAAPYGDAVTAATVADPLFPRFEAAAHLSEERNGSLAAVTHACSGVGGRRAILLNDTRGGAVHEINEEVCGFARALVAEAEASAAAAAAAAASAAAARANTTAVASNSTGGGGASGTAAAAAATRKSRRESRGSSPRGRGSLCATRRARRSPAGTAPSTRSPTGTFRTCSSCGSPWRSAARRTSTA